MENKEEREKKNHVLPVARFLISRQQSAKFKARAPINRLRNAQKASQPPPNSPSLHRTLTPTTTERTPPKRSPNAHNESQRVWMYAWAEVQTKCRTRTNERIGCARERSRISLASGDFSNTLSAWRSPHVGSVLRRTNAAAQQFKWWRARTQQQQQQQHIVLVSLKKMLLSS